MAIRFALLAVHYRHSLNFTFEGLKEAGEVIKKLDDCYWQCLSRACLLDVPERTENETVYEGGIGSDMERFFASSRIALMLSSMAISELSYNEPDKPRSVMWQP